MFLMSSLHNYAAVMDTKRQIKTNVSAAFELTT